jgi:signal transduction histidine kinase
MSTTPRPNVLVVNDDPASLLALAQVLGGAADAVGFTVVTARSGREALREVLLRRFAVILLDVNMPDMDGFETAAAIQARAASADIPIIFVTAFMADELSKLTAYRYQAADFLFSPIVPQVLIAKVSVFVSLAAKNEKLLRQAEALAQQSAAIAAANTKLVVAMQEREIAEHSSRAKDEFLAMLSHELRNPLAAIKNAIAVLNMPATSKDMSVRANQIIGRQTAHLRNIVGEILDLSRAMSGKIQLNRHAVDLAAVVSGALETVAGTTPVADWDVRLAADTAWVDGDPGRLQQVVCHLIENALKYTAAGGSVHICVEATGADAVLTVKDTGIGMSPDLLPHVFDVFSQGAVSLDRSLGGLGIGLAIVKCLAELHGGRVGVHSEGVGHGAEFTLRLPLLPLAPSQQPVGAHEPASVK